MMRSIRTLLRFTLPALLLILGWPSIAHADPLGISLGTVLISMAVSAASTAGGMLLTRLLTPKPKPNELGRMQGAIQLSDSSWNLMNPELYGTPGADGIGGCNLGVNVIWMNKEGVRETRTTVPSSSGGGGKGPPKPPPDVKITYDCDIACLVGKGPLEVLRIKFNDDVVYNVTRAGAGNENRQYEAENLTDNTFSGGASVVVNSGYSGGKYVDLPNTDWVQFGHVEAASNTVFDLTIAYSSPDPITLNLSVNGGGAVALNLPDTDTAIQVFTTQVTLAIGTTNTIRLTNASASHIAIDRIMMLVVPPVPPEPVPGLDDDWRRFRFAGVTGGVDQYFPSERPYNHFLPMDPYAVDPRPALRASALPSQSVDGSMDTTIVGGAYADLIIYEGNDDQEPDPVIQADIDGLYGAGSTPAYLDDCYFRISKLNLSKYNGFPNITVVAAHKTLHTVEEILVFRAKKVGLLDADLDLTATAATETRGYIITQQESPADTMLSFAKQFNFDFTETPDGVVQAVDLSDRTIVDDIAESELGAFERNESQQLDFVTTEVPDESQMWKYSRVQFFNPLKDWQVDSREDIYPFTNSEQTGTLDLNATMLPDEAYNVARRLLQMHWAAATPHGFVLPDSRIWLYPTNRIRVPITGELRTVRITEMQGTSPGVLRCASIPDELAVFVSAGLVPIPHPIPVIVPANSVATFMDIPLLHPQSIPGIYIAACRRDPNSGDWPGATAFRYKGGEWQQMTTFVAQSTMGRTTNTLADVPADWADTRIEFIDIFYRGTAGGGDYGTGALDRAPDTDGELNPWSERLRREDALVVGKALGRSLFLGTEYFNRGRTDTEFIQDAYSAYLNREPSPSEISDWLAILAGGATREEVITPGFDDSIEFKDRVAAAAATFFDDDSTVTVDLFYGELSTITDQEAREGNNFWVIGDEALIIAEWTRDLGAPNRWVGTHMIRRLKGTDAASATHATGERAVLMNSAVRFVELDAGSDTGVTYTWKVTTTGQRLEDVAPISVTWNGASIPASLDPHVPTIGDAATITKDDASPSWIIYTPRPKAYAATLIDLELWQFSDSGGTTLVRVVPGNISGRSSLPQSVADAYFRYRWRNQSDEDAGGGRGWSDLSPVSAIAYGTGNATQPPDDSGVPPPPIDQFDSGYRGRGDQPRPY